jgi:hypothetical protein
MVSPIEEIAATLIQIRYSRSGSDQWYPLAIYRGNQGRIIACKTAKACSRVSAAPQPGSLFLGPTSKQIRPCLLPR